MKLEMLEKDELSEINELLKLIEALEEKLGCKVITCYDNHVYVQLNDKLIVKIKDHEVEDLIK